MKIGMNHLKLIYILLTVLLLEQPIYAQSWQWGKRGGSYSSPTGAAGWDEEAVDVATDMNGNVYTLSKVQVPGLDIDSHTKSGWSSGEILVSSFKCDGTYRWSKIMGGHQDDDPVAIKTDRQGGVYITGYLVANSSSLAIDIDTSWAGGHHKTLFLAKFDTGGSYKWLAMPQPDTAGVSASASCASYDIDVDTAGNVFWLCDLAPGAYAGGAYIVPTNSIHMLKYNRYGACMGGIPMQITLSGLSPSFKFKRNHSTDKFYVTGDRPWFSAIMMGTTSNLRPCIWVASIMQARACG